MALAGVNKTTSAGGYKARMQMDRSYRPQSVRNRQLGGIHPPKGMIPFNLFPEIADAIPAALGSIVVETTENVAKKADGRVPNVTGRLKDSQRVRYSRSSKTGAVVSGRIDYKAVDPSSTDPNHEYAFYVEVGTYKTRAQPFLLPSLIEERQPFYSKCRNLERRIQAVG